MTREISNEEFIMKPKVDYCFKHLMAHEEVRRGFLAAVLKVRPEEIAGSRLLPTELRKDYAEDKLGILDVRVSLTNGAEIDVEIQLRYFDYWTDVHCSI